MDAIETGSILREDKKYTLKYKNPDHKSKLLKLYDIKTSKDCWTHKVPDLIKVGYINGYCNNKKHKYTPLFNKHTLAYADHFDSSFGLAAINDKDKVQVSIDRFGQVTTEGRDYKHIFKHRDKVKTFMLDLLKDVYGMTRTEPKAPEIVLNAVIGTSGAGFGHGGNNRDYLKRNFNTVHDYLYAPHIYFRDNKPVHQFAVKEEVRLKTKPPRTYIILEQEYLNIGRMVSLDFNEQLEHTHLTGPSAVGLSMQDWDIRMKPFQGNKVIIWDGENYDRSQAGAFLEMVGEIRADLMEDPYYKNIIRLFYHYIVNKLVVGPNGDLYSMFNGNPSGQPNTTIDNVLVHIIIFAYCWLYTHKTLKGFKDFLIKSNWCCYGDDGISSLLPEYEDFFLSVVNNFWKKLNGLNCTCEVFDNYLDADFLGKKSTLREGKLYPIPSDTNRLVANYVFKWKSNRLDLLSVLEKQTAYYNTMYNTCLKEGDSTLEFARQFINEEFRPRLVQLLNSDLYDAKIKRIFLKVIFEVIPRENGGPNIGHRFPKAFSPFQQQSGACIIDEAKCKYCMLTYKEWKDAKMANEKGKYSGLSESQMKLRYDAYVQTETSRGTKSTNNSRNTAPVSNVNNVFKTEDKRALEKSLKEEKAKDALEELQACHTAGVEIPEKYIVFPGVSEYAVSQTYKQTFTISSTVQNGKSQMLHLFQNDISKFRQAGTIQADNKMVFENGWIPMTTYEFFQNLIQLLVFILKE